MPYDTDEIWMSENDETDNVKTTELNQTYSKQQQNDIKLLVRLQQEMR